MPIDVTEFWNKKILGWERGRYNPSKEKTNHFLERIANSASSSIRYRLDIAGKLLAPHVKGKNILEIGCGSGLLTQAIMEAGAKSYLGIDIADAAIAEAEKKVIGHTWSDRVLYKVGDIASTPEGKYDIVISLGVLDWLNDDELDQLFKISQHTDFFHAISEKRFHPQQWLHRIYVHLSYGYRSKGYVPRYLSADFIKNIAQKYGAKKVYFFRNSKLSFGAIASSLPIA